MRKREGRDEEEKGKRWGKDEEEKRYAVHGSRFTVNRNADFGRQIKRKVE
jgi:hypothetical protein